MRPPSRCSVREILKVALKASKLSTVHTAGVCRCAPYHTRTPHLKTAKFRAPEHARGAPPPPLAPHDLHAGHHGPSQWPGCHSHLGRRPSHRPRTPPPPQTQSKSDPAAAVQETAGRTKRPLTTATRATTARPGGTGVATHPPDAPGPPAPAPGASPPPAGRARRFLAAPRPRA